MLLIAREWASFLMNANFSPFPHHFTCPDSFSSIFLCFQTLSIYLQWMANKNYVHKPFDWLWYNCITACVDCKWQNGKKVSEVCCVIIVSIFLVLFYIFSWDCCGRCSERWVTVTTISYVSINVVPSLSRHTLQFCKPFWKQFVLKGVTLFKSLDLSVISVWLYYLEKIYWRIAQY